jgi:hypothetical protein
MLDYFNVWRNEVKKADLWCFNKVGEFYYYFIIYYKDCVFLKI